MAAMQPILRLRRAFRSLGADPERADEAADAIDEFAYGRRESDLRHAEMMAEIREYMASLRNQFLFGVLLIAGLVIGVLTLVIALFD